MGINSLYARHHRGWGLGIRSAVDTVNTLIIADAIKDKGKGSANDYVFKIQEQLINIKVALEAANQKLIALEKENINLKSRMRRLEKRSK